MLLLDRARWRTTGNLVWPRNITPILLPSRSPELNPVEQAWQYLRANYLSNRVFDDYDAIIDAACEAWRVTPTRAARRRLALRYGSGRSSLEKPISGLFVCFANHSSHPQGGGSQASRGRQALRSKILLQPSHFQAPRLQRGDGLRRCVHASERGVVGHFLHQRGAAERF